MKKLFVLATGLLLSVVSFSQTQFEVLSDNGSKILKGIISRDILEKDTAFKWYAPSQKGYTPNPDAITGLKHNADSIHLIVFMGTWCEDSHYIVPKFFALLDAAGFAKNKVSLIGTDRDKKTIGTLCEALQVTNVPTIIVMRNGKETGRVVEYGKTGLFDKDLALLLGK